MNRIINNTLSIPTFTINDIKDETIEDKTIIERLVKNMVLIENGMSLLNIYNIKTFRGTLVATAKPEAIEVDSFYMLKYPIIQKEWTLLMGYDPSEYQVNDENLPVFNVTYEECLRFIAKLNRITGLKFDLPTSAQWDYAAHGGRANSCHFYNKTFAEIEEHVWIDVDPPFPVGLKEPNTLGLYDMFGNIGELCKRVNKENIVKGGTIRSKKIDGPIYNGYSTYHYEDYWTEEYASNNIGFRLVCNEVDIKSLQ